MKKMRGFMILAAALMLALTACGGKGDTSSQTEAARDEEPDMGSVTDLGQYKGLKLTKDSTVVTDAEVDEMMQSILDANPQYVEVDRPAGNGDRVNIDFIGLMDGEEFDGGSAENYYLTLGSGAFIDGFEEGLLGAETGEKRSLNLTFPEDYYSELAGQDVKFNVTVNSIEETVPAVMDDEFVKSISEYDTVNEFREEIFNEIQDYKNETAETNLQRAALQAVADDSAFDLNQSYADQNLQYNLSYTEYMASMYGMTMDDFLSYGYGMTSEEFEGYCRDLIEEQMKQTLVVDAIAEKENMRLSESDLQYAADKLYEDLDSLKESDPDYLNDNALAYKVANFIIDNAEVSEEKAAEDTAE